MNGIEPSPSASVPNNSRSPRFTQQFYDNPGKLQWLLGIMAYFETPSITVSRAVMLFVAFLIVTLTVIMLVPSHSQATNVLIGLQIC